jgi:transcription elongation factor Elf1
MALTPMFRCKNHPTESYLQGSTKNCPECKQNYTNFKTNCPFCGKEKLFNKLKEHIELCSINTNFCPKYIVVLVSVGQRAFLYSKTLDWVFSRFIPDVQIHNITHHPNNTANSLNILKSKLMDSSCLSPFQIIKNENLKPLRTFIEKLDHVVFVFVIQDIYVEEYQTSLKSLNLNQGFVRGESEHRENKYIYESTHKYSEVYITLPSNSLDVGITKQQLCDHIMNIKQIEQQ